MNFNPQPLYVLHRCHWLFVISQGDDTMIQWWRPSPSLMAIIAKKAFTSLALANMLAAISVKIKLQIKRNINHHPDHLKTFFGNTNSVGSVICLLPKLPPQKLWDLYVYDSCCLPLLPSRIKIFLPKSCAFAADLSSDKSASVLYYPNVYLLHILPKVMGILPEALQ